MPPKVCVKCRLRAPWYFSKINRDFVRGLPACGSEPCAAGRNDRMGDVSMELESAQGPSQSRALSKLLDRLGLRRSVSFILLERVRFSLGRRDTSAMPT